MIKNHNHLIFQYISALISKPILERFINRLSINNKINIILDLEDSIQDVRNKKNNIVLKSEARNNLKNLLQDKVDINIGIRINQINTDEFRKDIEFLEENVFFKWEYIVLPKVEKLNDIQEYLKYLKKIQYNELIICIESEKGFNNLKKILSTNLKGISKIQFGHFDFFLDKGIFPIPNQDNFIFWEYCNKIISETEMYGYTYLHSPINKLESNFVLSILNYLSNICKNEFGFATVSIGQSKILYENTIEETKPLRIKKEHRDKKPYAIQIINYFETSKKKGFSFMYNSKGKSFIPPQEYFSAIKYLSSK